jgi:hypothetical protein
MKKLIFISTVILLAINFVNAQSWGDGILSIPARIWTDPVIYNYDEDVTWYFDLSAEDASIKAVLDEATLALWTWRPTNPGDEHFGGGYSLAQPEMILTHRGGYVYSITLKPVVFYSVTKESIEGGDAQSFVMHIRVFSKDNDANINCAAFHIRYPHFLVNDLKTNNIPSTVYPPVEEGADKPKVNATTSMAVMFNNDYVKADFTGDLFVNSSLNKDEHPVVYSAENPELTKAKTYFGIDDVYVFNIKNPSQFYGTAYDYQIDSIHYEFKTAASQHVIYSGMQEFIPVKPWQPLTSGLNYPAISNNNLKIKIENGILSVNASRFEIYSILGASVAKSNSGSTDISNLPKGIYLVKAHNGALQFIKM